MKFSDWILIASITMILIGAIQGTLSYMYFKAGRQEGIVNTRSGTYPVTKKAPGDKRYKQMAGIAAVCAGIGLVLLGTTLVIKHIAQKRRARITGSWVYF